MVSEVERLSRKFTRNGWFYEILRKLWTTPNFKRHYRYITVVGKENIPKKGPIIYALNHQNSLMDAMAVVSTQPHQTVFVARADIFKKPAIIKILHFLRILPIYRRRDGGKSVDNNQETFDIVDAILKAKMVHGIMPEGVFNPYKRLNMLQKGIFRTALRAQEAFGTEGGVQIIPVGLNWQDPRGDFKDLTVFYGKPIAVADYYNLYLENPPKAFVQLQDLLSDAMKKLIINIKTEKYYDTINGFREYFSADYASVHNYNSEDATEFLNAQQDLIAQLEKIEQENEQELEQLTTLLNNYKNGLKKLNLRDWLLRKGKFSFLRTVCDFFILLIASPFALIGAVLGCFPLSLARKYQALIKDPQFRSSVKYVVAMCARGVQNIIFFTLLIIFYTNICVTLVAVFLILFGERMMLLYVEHYKRTFGRIRYNRLLRKKNAELLNLIQLRHSLLEPITQS